MIILHYHPALFAWLFYRPEFLTVIIRGEVLADQCYVTIQSLQTCACVSYATSVHSCCGRFRPNNHANSTIDTIRVCQTPFLPTFHLKAHSDARDRKITLVPSSSHLVRCSHVDSVVLVLASPLAYSAPGSKWRLSDTVRP